MWARRAAWAAWVGRAAAVVIVAALVSHGSIAQAAGSDDEACMMCHRDSDLVRDRDGSSVHVAPTALSRTAHAGLACASCHAGATAIPHPERLPAVRCASCHAAQGKSAAASVHGAAGPGIGCQDCHGAHEASAPVGPREACGKCHAEVVEGYEQGIHAKVRNGGDTDGPTCRDCHGGAHNIRGHEDPASPSHHARLVDTCGRCHADRELMTRRKIAIPEAYQLFRLSVHGRSEDPNAAVCSDCHESHRMLRATDPASPIYKRNIPRTCGRCHQKAEADYTIGVHGTALERGVTASPVCTDCHGEHLIRGPHDKASPVAAGRVTATCAHCHEAEGIRETFGLPAGRLSTFRDSFHGLAARGGSPVVADCASCHLHHDILPSSDPRSAIHPDHLASTCGRCHPGAAAGFASGPVHVAMVAPGHPLLVWVRAFYIVLIVLTIGFMLAHNGLDFVSKLRRHWSEHLGRAARSAEHAGRTYLRMTVFERVQHGVLAVSFLLLVYTGFALKFPESWPFAWLARLDQGYALRSLAHRSAAVVMLGVSFVHVGYLFSRRGRRMFADMMPRWSDVGDLWHNLLYMSGRRAEPPPFPRFGYIEKAEYLALIWGTVIMTVTGIALWFTNQTLQWFPKWSLDLATIIHYYEAWLAFLAIVVWHWYQTIVNPDVYPMSFTWLTGRISEADLHHEHRGEWARLQSEEAQSREEPARDPSDAATPGDESDAEQPRPRADSVETQPRREDRARTKRTEEDPSP